MTTYFGSTASETLNSSNWNYSWDTFNMYGGNDRVVTPSTGMAYSFYGGDGNDYFQGDTANDYVKGGYDNDELRGNDGNDNIYGEHGNDKCIGGYGYDFLSGGYGDDRLFGGKGKDINYGDDGTDHFVIGRGHSYASNTEADLITDWNAYEDYIDSSLRGSAGNYGEKATGAKSIDAARQVAENSYLKHEDHAFIYNADTDVGYLLSDLDRNGSFETGVILNGAGSATDMNWSDIV